ncbi:hypothetical protein GCM10029964_017170 [Kibdelosporangium lantanae]
MYFPVGLAVFHASAKAALISRETDCGPRMLESTCSKFVIIKKIRSKMIRVKKISGEGDDVHFVTWKKRSPSKSSWSRAKRRTGACSTTT